MTEEKLEDGEHREHGKIFHTKNGRLDGEYQEFDIEGRLTTSAEYSDGLLHGKRISNALDAEDPARKHELSDYNQESISNEETYDHGVLQHRKLTRRTHLGSHFDDDTCEYCEDMEYKDGKPYSGRMTLSVDLAADTTDRKSYQYERTFRDGKPYGKIVWREKLPDEKAGKYLDIDGEYKDGQFTGTQIIRDEDLCTVEHFSEGQKVNEEVYALAPKSMGIRFFRNSGFGDLKAVGSLKCKRIFYPDKISETTYCGDTGEIYMLKFTGKEKETKRTEYNDLPFDIRTCGDIAEEEIRRTGRYDLSAITGKRLTQAPKGKIVECEVKQTDNGYIKDGAYEETYDKGRITGTYRDGQKNGVFTEYNSDGTVANVKHYCSGKDVTKTFERVKKTAAENLSPEKGVVLPKRSKVSKKLALLKSAVKEKFER